MNNPLLQAQLAGLSEEEKKVVIAQAMQKAKSVSMNPQALKIAQKVAREKNLDRISDPSKIFSSDVGIAVKDALMADFEAQKSFGILNPADKLPEGFGPVPAEVRAIFEREDTVNSCSNCLIKRKCIHDGETDSYLCSANCKVEMKRKLGLALEINYCFNPACEEVGPNTCAACKQVFYCSVDCQKANWKAHKIICKALRAQRDSYEEFERRKQTEAEETMNVEDMAAIDDILDNGEEIKEAIDEEDAAIIDSIAAGN